MQETWYTAIEHHVNLVAVLTILGFLAREHKVYGRMKERMNELWFNYCGERQKLYSPVENGATPVIPPRPTQQ
jgi:hypothetical protein